MIIKLVHQIVPVGIEGFIQVLVVFLKQVDKLMVDWAAFFLQNSKIAVGQVFKILVEGPSRDAEFFHNGSNIDVFQVGLLKKFL